MHRYRFIRLKNVTQFRQILSSNPKKFSTNVVKTFQRYTTSDKERLLSGELWDGSSLRLKWVKNNDVPKGHMAVYVGPNQQRFVIPLKCLSSPEFRVLMDEIAEEFGYKHEGGLHIPCDENVFEKILLRWNVSNGKRNRQVYS